MTALFISKDCAEQVDKRGCSHLSRVQSPPFSVRSSTHIHLQWCCHEPKHTLRHEYVAAHTPRHARHSRLSETCRQLYMLPTGFAKPSTFTDTISTSAHSNRFTHTHEQAILRCFVFGVAVDSISFLRFVTFTLSIF